MNAKKTALWIAFSCLVAGFATITSVPALADAPMMGIVVMHGKGSAPGKAVGSLAGALRDKGYRVANIEMPWSGNRNYDVDTAQAEAEIEAALTKLRSEGAQKVFVAGHSQGGAFALHFAAKGSADGIICMAPGGSVATNVFREKLGETLERARKLVAEGKGSEKARLADFESSKGVYPIVAAPAVYLTWFDPEGAMNTQRAARAARPETPILWLVAKDDYPGLRKANIPLFQKFPTNPLTRMVEPDADHHGAPSASLDEIVRWTTEVANAAKR